MIENLSNREQHRIADRAYRRAHYTGLPLHQMLRSETARFGRKHGWRLGFDYFASTQTEADQKLRDTFPGPADASHEPEDIAKQPGHEAADTVSKVPSPIPEERNDTSTFPGGDDTGTVAAETRERTPEVAAEKARAKKPSKAKAEIPADAPAATGPTPEAAAIAASKADNVGKRVSWKMVGKDFAGTIKHVIPEGATPKSLGIEAGTDKPRTGHSYVVEIDGTGKLSWPMLNTLTMLD